MTDLGGPGVGSGARARSDTAGVRAIVLYKSVKSGTELAVVLVALALWPFGLPALLHRLALGLQQHATQGWAVLLAVWLERGSSDRGVELSLLALAGDGTLTAVEAWALRRGRWWGPWLVVLATGALLPFELVALVRAPHLSRSLLLAANLVIVTYLARRARRSP
jgi:uncharacterized membrane protein (DUF2068 family)